MSLVLTNQGERIFLEAGLNKTAPQDLDLKLFKNNYTPVEASLESDLTEANFTGYAGIALTAANWVTTPGDPTSDAYPLQTFTSSAGSQSQSVYGYYLVQRTSGKLVYLERFTDGPYVIVNNGDAIKVTPIITGE